MKNYLQIIFILSFIFVNSNTTAQNQPEPGMVISEFGPSYNIENPDYKTSLTQAFKVVFDITETSEDPSEINKYIETVARFLNIHVKAGKPLNSMEVFVVMHGGAAQTLLKNEFYREVYKTDNPNIALFEALSDNGVQIILCGQTAMARNITEERRIPNAQISLSAMTALVQLQNEGFRLINF